MYLTAQRVISPRHEQGINAYLYVHGPLSLDVDPQSLPDANPGHPVKRREQVKPPGNRVRSYLDIVVPDNTRMEDIQAAVEGVLATTQPTDFRQMTVPIGPSFVVRFGLEQPLAKVWRAELHTLLSQALDLLDARQDAQ